MSLSTKIKLLFLINSFILIAYGEDLGRQLCKPQGASWEEDGTQYRSLPYHGDLYAYALCKADLTLTGSSKVRCVDGYWENPLPRCERINSRQCEPPPYSDRVIKKCEGGTLMGSVCQYRCPNQYTLVGSVERRCNINLQWTGVQPRCILDNTSKKPKGNPAHSFDYARYSDNERRREISKSYDEPATCNINNGGCEQICNSIHGHPVCSCTEGYRPIEGGKCQEVRTIAVPVSGSVHNRNQGRNDIYKNDRITTACDFDNGGCEQICSFSLGFTVCSCREGFRLLKDGKCQDIDECQERRHYCRYSCINTVGSYKCDCPHGYAIKDEYYCEEVNTIAVPVSESFHNRNHGRNEIYKDDRITTACDFDNGGCEQICSFSLGFTVCSCREGFRSLRDGKCQDIDECQERRHYCRYSCINTVGSYKCDCPHGYAIKDEYYCEDINECQWSHLNHCHQKCINIRGSYSCSCEPGYVLKNSYDCEDVNECQLPHLNRCNQKCINTPGSYLCLCEPGYILKNSYECEGCRVNSYSSESRNICIECPPNSVTGSNAKSSIDDCQCIPGFVGSPSRNIPCTDINECLTNNFGCSHLCINTPGSALCSCPLGFEVTDDNKTCVDIDECKIQNGGCEKFCYNFLGSFNCSCTDGYILAKDHYSCVDNDECADGNNGGCSDICINFPGGYYCSCPKGFRLDTEGKTCLAPRCLSVAVPHRSSMHCKYVNRTKVISKPHDNSSLNPPDYPLGTTCRIKCDKGFKVTTPYEVIECLEDGSWNTTTPQCVASHCPSLRIPTNGDVYPPVCKEDFVPVLQQCYFTCNPGYEIFGNKTMVKCKNNVTWTNDPPSCRPIHTPPSITCPEDIIMDLGWDERYSNVSVPQPITNMENIEIFPDWIKLEQPIPLKSGKINVLFKVTNFDTNMTSECIMAIHVVDKQAPMFIKCPEPFSVNDVGHQGVPITWDEPEATDNVEIHTVEKNLEPNSTLGAGVHFVEYIAKDAAGNSATCAFHINITRGHCKDLSDPENGKALCMDWLMGRLCRPACDPGYFRDPDEPKFFACGDSGKWTPTDDISPCLPNCANGTIWSSISQSCEEEFLSNINRR